MPHMPTAPRAPSTAREPPAANTPSVAHMPAPPCVPMAIIAMGDLRAELNRHHDLEDSRITIERQRERHHNIKGRNLEREFNSLSPTREAPAARTTRSLAPLGSQEDAWCSLHTSVWLSGHASFDPTCWRSTTGLSILSSSCRSTPSPSSQ
jgi:hypothetical protein